MLFFTLSYIPWNAQIFSLNKILSMIFDNAYTCVTQTPIQIQNISAVPEISLMPWISEVAE